MHRRVVGSGVHRDVHRNDVNRCHHHLLRAVQRRSLQGEPGKPEIGIRKRAFVDQLVERQRLEKPR